MSLTLTLTLPVPHVDLGTGLLQNADNRPTIITLVEMVAVGMVRVGMVSVGMVGVGMVPAPRIGGRTNGPKGNITPPASLNWCTHKYSKLPKTQLATKEHKASSDISFSTVASTLTDCSMFQLSCRS